MSRLSDLVLKVTFCSKNMLERRFLMRELLSSPLPAGSDLSASLVTTFPLDLLDLSLGCTRIKGRVASLSRRWPLIWHRQGQEQHKARPIRQHQREKAPAMTEVRRPGRTQRGPHFHLELRQQRHMSQRESGNAKQEVVADDWQVWASPCSHPSLLPQTTRSITQVTKLIPRPSFLFIAFGWFCPGPGFSLLKAAFPASWGQILGLCKNPRGDFRCPINKCDPNKET